MLVSLQEQVDKSQDSDKEEEATYDAQACTAEEILNHMPTTIVACRTHCPVLVKNDPDEIYCECKDEQQVSPAWMGEELCFDDLPKLVNLLSNILHLLEDFVVAVVLRVS